MRSAYNSALSNAIIGSIRIYYKNNTENSAAIPDISSEYVKFVKNYKIISRKVSAYTVSVRIAANLDNMALQDAKLLILNPVNTAVFVFDGIPDNVLSEDEQSKIINKALTAKNFSTSEQKNYIYNISDMSDSIQVSKQFKNNFSYYLFKFKFQPSFDKLKDVDNSCELTTTTDIISRGGQSRILKIETSSRRFNEKQCIADAVTKAIGTTIDYVRTNIIQVPEQNKILTKYKLKAVNFNNMVGTNNFISALKQRGFITNYKAVSFSAKEIIFEIESYFTEADLELKLKMITSDDMNFTYSTDAEGIVLDFSPKETVLNEQGVEHKQ